MENLIWQRSDENKLINLFSQEGIQLEIRKSVQERDKIDKRRKDVSDDVRVRNQPFVQKIEAKKDEDGREIETNYSDLSSKLEICKSDSNRFIRTVDDIKTGKKIAQAKPFACVADRTTLSYCLTCKTKESIFQKCKTCGLVLFCKSLNCPKNKSHRYECNTNFHCIEFNDDLDVKLAIQMVFQSLIIFGDNVTSLKEAALEHQRNQRDNVYPRQIKTDKHRFECIMKLCGRETSDTVRKVNEAFRIIMELPQIKSRFKLNDDEYFLQHLLGHFLKVITSNSFVVEQEELKLTMIYDSISFFNHSCSPNAINFIIQTNMHVISSRHIHNNEEVFICYAPEFHDTEWTSYHRERELWKKWRFHCDCKRCNAREINEIDIEEVQSQLKEHKKRKTGHQVEFLGKKLETLTKDELGKWTPEIGAYCIEYFEACKKQMP